MFVSKMLGMLPAIWTDDDTESDNECKSYFNLYTFLIFAGKYWKFFISIVWQMF